MPTKPQTKFPYLKYLQLFLLELLKTKILILTWSLGIWLQSNMICGLNLHIPPNSAPVLGTSVN